MRRITMLVGSPGSALLEQGATELRIDVSARGSLLQQGAFARAGGGLCV